MHKLKHSKAQIAHRFASGNAVGFQTNRLSLRADLIRFIVRSLQETTGSSFQFAIRLLKLSDKLSSKLKKKRKKLLLLKTQPARSLQNELSSLSLSIFLCLSQLKRKLESNSTASSQFNHSMQFNSIRFDSFNQSFNSRERESLSLVLAHCASINRIIIDRNETPTTVKRERERELARCS